MINENISKEDIYFLKNIYLLRCLTLKQAYETFYKKDIKTFNKFIDTKLKFFLDNEIIEEVLFNKENIALFLTKKGIEIVKENYKLPNEIFDNKTKTITKGVYTASQLKMMSRLIPHQVHLNQFYLDFQRIYELRKYNFKWDYYDEKFVSSYFSIRPDGLINLCGIDLFLEMDMSTESKKQLVEKWKHYRTFLSSNDYLNNPKKIIVLFIIENTSNLTNRKNIVKSSVNEIMLDIFNENLEIIIGSKNEILLKLYNDIIPSILQQNKKIDELKNILTNNHNFNISSANLLKSSLNNKAYEYYLTKTDKKGNIVIENGEIQEYLLDYFIKDSFNIISKIAYNMQSVNSFKYYHKREFKYIVVVEDLDYLFAELDLYNLSTEKNVYYTTINRLKELKLYEALVQFNNLGEMYSFTSPELKGRKYLNLK